MVENMTARTRAPRVLIVVGTRPEAIKLAPVVLAMAADARLEPVLVTTGQHTGLVDDALQVFGLTARHRCRAHVEEHRQLSHRTARCLGDLAAIVELEQPAAVVVQGDTASTVAGALAGFYAGIPVVHVEAGLRTGDLSSPWPEEGNRRLVTAVASLHLAPTAGSAANLHAEGVDPRRVHVTGNTVVDALLHTVGQSFRFGDPALEAVHAGRTRVVLFTAHRREAWGDPVRHVATAIRHLADEHPDVTVVAALHPNPVVRNAVLPVLADHPQVLVCEPPPYGPFVRLMARSSLIITDSGGIQEEAPSLGVPVLVTRAVTERTEALAPGRVELVGTDPMRITGAARRLLATRAPGTRENPYGDGSAAVRSLEPIAALLGLGADPRDVGDLAVTT